MNKPKSELAAIVLEIKMAATGALAEIWLPHPRPSPEHSLGVLVGAVCEIQKLGIEALLLIGGEMHPEPVVTDPALILRLLHIAEGAQAWWNTFHGGDTDLPVWMQRCNATLADIGVVGLPPGDER